MIKIEKRTIEVNLISFKNQLRIFSRLIKTHNPSTIGIGVTQITKEQFIELLDNINN